jgi:hypothetical protein
MLLKSLVYVVALKCIECIASPDCNGDTHFGHDAWVHFQRGFVEEPAWAVGSEVPLEAGGYVFCEIVVVGGYIHNFGGPG